nr:hypothetical protein [Tanacetum cinerariifolium]
SVPVRPTTYTLAEALFLPPWLPCAPLIVSIIGICHNTTVTCKMTNFVAVVALRSTWTVVGTDLASYNQRFQELALLCGRMFSEESDKIEKYVGGLPDMIHGSVVASKPKTMQEAIEIATELMDKKIRTFAERETTSKRKVENTSRTTRNQQQQQHSNKRQNTGRVYTAASGHYRRECPKLKNNNNHGNQGGRNNAPSRVYAVGRAGTDPDANVVT